jgi:hypothetical protein
MPCPPTKSGRNTYTATQGSRGEENEAPIVQLAKKAMYEEFGVVVIARYQASPAPALPNSNNNDAS